MALFKRFTNWQGLDVRTSDLTRDDNYASETQNVEVDKEQNLVKRPGIVNQSTVGANEGGNGLFNYDGDSQLIAAGPSGVSRFSTNTWVNTTNSGGNTYDTTNLSHSSQYLKSMYLSNGVNELLKYDGSTWYRAGALNSSLGAVRSVVDSGAAAAAQTVQYRVEFLSRDKNEFRATGTVFNIEGVFSLAELASSTDTQDVTFLVPCKSWQSLTDLGITANVYQQGVNYAAFTIVIAPDDRVYIALVLTSGTNTGPGNELVDFETERDAFINEWIEVITAVDFTPTGFNARGAIVNGAQAGVNTVDVTSAFTFPAGFSHDVEVGDVIRVPATSNFAEQYRNVTGVTATTITFDGPVVTFPASYPISVGLYANVYNRDKSLGGDFQQTVTEYTPTILESREIPINVFSPLNTYTFQRDPSAVGPAYVQAITSNGFDARGHPPKESKYSIIHQQALVLAGFPDEPHTIKFSRNQFVEEFPASDQSIRIGDNDDGVITGLGVSNEFLVVFKEQAVYYVSGNLNLGTIRVERNVGFGLGSAAHATVQEVDGNLIYLGRRGVFSLVGGGRPRELSFRVNPLILDTAGLTLADSLAVNDIKRQKLYFFIPGTTDLVLMYDYYYDSWWEHNTIDFSGGVVEFADEIYYVDSSQELQKFDSSVFNDNGVAIDAFYKSNWMNFGSPATFKKVLDILVYALKTLNFDLRVRTEKNWVASSYDTDVTLTFDASNRFLKNNVAGQKIQSFRVDLSNNVLNEGMQVTGYELEVEAPQRQKIKGC